MNNGRSVNVRAELRPAFAGRGAGSLLEIDAWIQSEISAISPLVERLMRLIEGSHCITGGDDAVQLALREALNNAIVHGNRLMKFVMDEVSFQQRATTLQTVFGSDVRVGRVSVSRYRHCGAAFGAA